MRVCEAIELLKTFPSEAFVMYKDRAGGIVELMDIEFQPGVEGDEIEPFAWLTF